MVKNFKLVLSLTKSSGEGPVYHKQDGQRFPSANTIKLNVNTKYRLLLTTRPATRIRHLTVHGEKIDFNQVKADGKSSESEREEMYRVESKWVSVSCVQTKRAKRSDIPILLELEDGVSLKLVLQTKFYPEFEDDHVRWGSELHGIEYECVIPEGATYVDVQKVRFL